MADTKAKKAAAEKSVTNKTVKKPVAEKAIKKVAAAEVKPVKKEAASKMAEISVNVIDLSGKSASKMALPGEMFGAKINPTLMAQAVRVYQFAQRQGTSSTKTRGEVNGTTKKVYRQKGTGRARHGAAKAHIFVGGGIAFGPKPRDFSLELPKKMRRAALFSALTQKLSESRVVIFDEKGITGKTKEMNEFIKAADFSSKKITVVVSGDSKLVSQSAGNLRNTTVIRAENLNAFVVLSSGTMLFVKDSIDTLKKTFLNKN